ncbi:MAG: BolA family transcriptional regulator [Rhodobacteraceae bacterium]|nr:BolA family transcriptional regulator [Paracoccaceae bacterium]
MTKADRIHNALTAAFAPLALEVINESEQHRGHGGYSDGETHYRVRMTADAFVAMSRIARHRAVHAALGAELVAEIHALALELLVPE